MPRAQLTAAEEDAMRRRLVDAALGVYRAEGLEALSFRRLADAMGLSHTLPYRYFAHKEALLVAMRVACTQQFERYVREREPLSAPPLERIRAIAAGYVEYARGSAAEYLLIFSTHQPPPDRYPELLAARRDLFDHAVEVLALCVQAGDLHGEPRQLAHEFWIALHGLMTLHVANQLVHGRSLDQLVGPLVERMIGLAANSPSPQANATVPATLPAIRRARASRSRR